MHIKVTYYRGRFEQGSAYADLEDCSEQCFVIGKMMSKITEKPLADQYLKIEVVQ